MLICYKEKESVLSLLEMRINLRLDNKYKQYGHLKDKVLLPAINVINENISTRLSFEEITRGRKVISIRFIIE